MRFSARAEGEGFEPSRDETAPNGFRDSFHLAQPCVLRPGARHNARQFAPRGLEHTGRIGTAWAFSRLLRLKVESQLREGAPPQTAQGRSQPPSWSSRRASVCVPRGDQRRDAADAEKCSGEPISVREHEQRHRKQDQSGRADVRAEPRMQAKPPSHRSSWMLGVHELFQSAGAPRRLSRRHPCQTRRVGETKRQTAREDRGTTSLAAGDCR
jgi:hypothetical protein